MPHFRPLAGLLDSSVSGFYSYTPCLVCSSTNMLAMRAALCALNIYDALRDRLIIRSLPAAVGQTRSCTCWDNMRSQRHMPIKVNESAIVAAIFAEHHVQESHVFVYNLVKLFQLVSFIQGNGLLERSRCCHGNALQQVPIALAVTKESATST